MKSLSFIRPMVKGLLLPVGVVLAMTLMLGPPAAKAQSITIDFRFDNNAGANPTVAGATTVTLAQGTAGQTYLVDVWATVSGGSPATMNGIKDVLLRGISDITTATSAFATGTGIGAVPQVTGPTASTTSFQYLPPLNAGGADASTPAYPVVKTSDLGSTNSVLASNTTNSATGVPDGILDFGGTVASQVFAPLSFTNAAVFSGGTAVGTNAQTWEIGTFKFTTGATGAAGATTLFWPAAAKGTGGGDISTNGSATTTNVAITPGTPLTFVVGGVVVTGAIADNTNGQNNFAAGTPQTFSITAGSPYTTVDSSVTNVNPNPGPGSPAFSPNGVGDRARILAGSNGTAGTQTVTMAWRTRTQAEAVGGAVFDPSLSKPTTGLISDVVNLTGLETTGTTTAPFVLDMTYNPALLPKGSTTNGHTTPSTLEGALAANKLIYMISLNPTTGLWDKAFAENTGNVITSPTDPSYGFDGSYATYSTTGPGAGKTLAQTMGAWGVDPTAHEVWAVLDHNSQFAVVPEPSTLLLVGLGLLGLVGLRRRVKA